MHWTIGSSLTSNLWQGGFKTLQHMNMHYDVIYVHSTAPPLHLPPPAIIHSCSRCLHARNTRELEGESRNLDSRMKFTLVVFKWFLNGPLEVQFYIFISDPTLLPHSISAVSANLISK
ncbi:hypothetical protein HELRODRAFT_164233 [Helobdella robusta]|uniref:Uncharacterized protein n=1 Tax=Helobdella robusta TaxID=6412 RepID=T1EV53_HELRO|nr:hypothetical protein HELRODRAFT_164233 [Helobdella robusta]ESN94401.1 hypothetical protein HELRODRAFT_164233 [Helobdella robusta]